MCFVLFFHAHSEESESLEFTVQFLILDSYYFALAKAAEVLFADGKTHSVIPTTKTIIIASVNAEELPNPAQVN